MPDEIPIIIADDHPIFRQGLLLGIQRDSSLRVAAEAEDGDAALTLIETLSPRVAVLDVDMPGKNGFEVAQAVREKNLPVAIIFLTMYKEEDAFNRALDLGAMGYILKDSAVTDILQAIKAAAAGKHFVSPSLTTYLINRSQRGATLVTQTPGLNSLTATERLVLKLITENKTTREIAAELFVSPRTVDNHRANITTKLNLQGSHALLKFALTHKSEI